MGGEGRGRGYLIDRVILVTFPCLSATEIVKVPVTGAGAVQVQVESPVDEKCFARFVPALMVPISCWEVIDRLSRFRPVP